MPTEESPQVGDWVRRLDDKRVGQVDHVAALGKPNPPTVWPLYQDDVIVRYAEGSESFCSGGAYFWTKWERFDPKALAHQAIEEALASPV
jgi:hypothetical protein